MRPSRCAFSCALVLAIGGLCLLPASAPAFSSGPPDGFAANPPSYNDCTACHASFPLNSGDGLLELVGLPSSYQSGQTYPLTVRLRDPGQQRWGFELTVLDDADFYAQGGSLAVTDSAHTQLSEDYEGTEDYLKHTLNGTYNGTPDGPVTWDFDWTAPDPGVSSVTFYVVGNAANGDFDSTGDYIYASSFPLEAGPPVPTISTTWGRVKSLYHGR
jgi:hypothetical protein